MSALAVMEEVAHLPTLIDRATQALAGARSAAEILEAREIGNIAYDASKRAARFAKAKGAHDEVTAAALRSQADANEIIAGAQRRLADEYDAAQERGEVASNGQRGKAVPDGNGLATVADLGLSRKEIHDARTLRDAERNAPGITKRALDAMVQQRQEPTKAALREAVLEAARLGARGPQGSASNRNPLYQAPTEAGKAWTHLYGVCRALAEWATDTNLDLAIAGRNERTDDQSSNVRALRRAAAILDHLAENIDAR